MNDAYVMKAILGMAAVTFVLRAIPFFTAAKWKDNHSVQTMGKFLPPAIMLILVAYSFKGVQWTMWPFGAVELVAVGAVIGFQVFFRNPFISIVAGTAIYVIARPLMAASGA